MAASWWDPRVAAARPRSRPAVAHRTAPWRCSRARRWAAERPAELVALQQIVRSGEKVARVQVAIAEELEGAAMKRVRAGLRDDVHNRARATAVFGAVAIGLYAELFHGIGIRERIVDVGVVVMIAAAVQ